MNCLYCNNPTAAISSDRSQCSQCFGEPRMSNWSTCARITTRYSYYFQIDFMIVNDQNSYQIFYAPNDNSSEIYIRSHEHGLSGKAISFPTPEPLTPDNVQEFLTRVLSLKAFL